MTYYRYQMRHHSDDGGTQTWHLNPSEFVAFAERTDAERGLFWASRGPVLAYGLTATLCGDRLTLVREWTGR